ncbi:GAF domain-containing protein [Anaerocolumna xylanovorans]|uniref:GAF domain-containing protein n=1 Tax=Anaerocolumna xylanovorans DSM 12503 TaxID=1121345 RepID=A0A1M7YJK8_9FIRM|nr:GAF domain-containing protein [Anaerocolumna xylanovorans]SHO52728.1 GAF domain-containing protein [Anaerocolumna xylanovorans DSM 12503]
MVEVSNLYPNDKKELYALLNSQLKALLDNEPDVIAGLSNASALLMGALKDINWSGFYLMKRGELLLGPFQGKTACVHIAVGRGVCGSAVLKDEVQLVTDVHEFPGHIACDSASRSEIVIPIHYNGTITGVLDIDSPLTCRFDLNDKEGLMEFVTILEELLDWSFS